MGDGVRVAVERGDAVPQFCGLDGAVQWGRRRQLRMHRLQGACSAAGTTASMAGHAAAWRSKGTSNRGHAWVLQKSASNFERQRSARAANGRDRSCCRKTARGGGFSAGARWLIGENPKALASVGAGLGGRGVAGHAYVRQRGGQTARRQAFARKEPRKRPLEKHRMERRCVASAAAASRTSDSLPPTIGGPAVGGRGRGLLLSRVLISGWFSAAQARDAASSMAGAVLASG